MATSSSGRPRPQRAPAPRRWPSCPGSGNHVHLPGCPSSFSPSPATRRLLGPGLGRAAPPWACRRPLPSHERHCPLSSFSCRPPLPFSSPSRRRIYSRPTGYGGHHRRSCHLRSSWRSPELFLGRDGASLGLVAAAAYFTPGATLPPPSLSLLAESARRERSPRERRWLEEPYHRTSGCRTRKLSRVHKISPRLCPPAPYVLRRRGSLWWWCWNWPTLPLQRCEWGSDVTAAAAAMRAGW